MARQDLRVMNSLSFLLAKRTKNLSIYAKDRSARQNDEHQNNIIYWFNLRVLKALSLLLAKMMTTKTT